MQNDYKILGARAAGSRAVATIARGKFAGIFSILFLLRRPLLYSHK